MDNKDTTHSPLPWRAVELYENDPKLAITSGESVIAWLASERDGIAGAPTLSEAKANAEIIEKLFAQNRTLRNAQKACDECDGPTMGHYRKLVEAVKLVASYARNAERDAGELSPRLIYEELEAAL
jgi:hypothetical protein